MKLRQVTLRKLAGYESISWKRLQPELNFPLGRNGAGKSTILEALALGLNYLAGRRTLNLLTKSFPDASIEITASTRPEPIVLPFATIHRSQGKRAYEEDLLVMQVVENRQPKNTIGDGRSEVRQHSMNRYPHAVSELKALLQTDADRRLAREVFDMCRRLQHTGPTDAWEWIEDAIRQRGPTRMRPVSCGQFDMIALALDLARVRLAVAQRRQSVFVILDNPETFLHPACQEPVLDLIRECLPDSQLFIGSHSLKLLSHREVKSVFWLSRDNRDENGHVAVQATRELTGGAQAAFFELYGNDVSSAVWNMVRSFERPEYFKFLWECAQPAQARARSDPAADRQMRALRPHFTAGRDAWTIVDYGAGHGDVLQALITWGGADTGIRYIGVEPAASDILRRRLAAAKESSAIAPASAVVAALGDVPGECDVAVLCNVCHEIPLPDLADLLAALLARLRRSPDARLVVHEVETLDAGEADFLMWTPADYTAVFGDVASLRVQVERPDLGGGVPLDTTIVSWAAADGDRPSDLADQLRTLFDRQLPAKKHALLDEITMLTQPAATRQEGFPEALRQRRLAFLVSQVTAVSQRERVVERAGAARSTQ